MREMPVIELKQNTERGFNIKYELILPSTENQVILYILQLTKQLNMAHTNIH